MQTTAEGVETADQQSILRMAGCNEMQGYLFSAAQPASEIATLLAASQLRTETRR
jgi:EAL domain-containing protein (putative c-di-GMP-specific phosphodiesterase class I)